VRSCRCAGCATAGRPRAGGFAIYLASKDGYEDSVLPTGGFAGAPQDALDCACDLYLDPDI